MPPLMPASRRLTWAVLGWLVGFVGTVIAAVVVVAVVTATTDREPGSTGSELLDDISIGGLVLLQLPLWLGLLGTPMLARRYGLDWARQLRWRMRPVDISIGAAAGAVLQLVAIPLLYWPIFQIFGDLDVEGPAQELADLAVSPLDVVLLGFMTVVMAPLAEEVFFRGLLQGALADRFSVRFSQRSAALVAMVVAAVAFGITHFQLVQLPALILVGLVNGWLVLRTGRLGPALWSHATFNAITVVALLLL